MTDLSSRASYTIGLLVAVTLLAIVIGPLAVQVEGWLAGRQAYLGPLAVARLAFTSALLPLAGGMLFCRLAPDIAKKVANPLMSVAAIMLAAGVLPILFTAWPAIASLIGNGTLVAFATFAIVALAVGHLLGGPDPDDRMVLALSTASRHPAIALAIAHASLPGDKTVLAAVLLYLLVSATASIPYVSWRKRIESHHLRLAVAIALAVCCAGRAFPARAQGVEVMPFGGYRFGGDLFELATQRPLDLDGAPALGVVVNVPLSDGLQVEALVARQDARASIPTTAFHPATRQRLTVDHWQSGGLQELSGGRVRPFLTGMLGVTRYAADGDSEVRFTVGAGGGVKLFPVRHLGVRVDGRVYTTFIDADVAFLACAPGTCIGALAVDVVWQAELTMGLVFRFR